jgi:hypothetical protein
MEENGKMESVGMFVKKTPSMKRENGKRRNILPFSMPSLFIFWMRENFLCVRESEWLREDENEVGLKEVFSMIFNVFLEGGKR